MILRNALLAFLVGKSPVCWVCLLYSFTAIGEDNCIVLISVLRQEVVRALFLCKERSANLSCKEDLGEYRLSVSIKLNQNHLRVEEHG